jgi:hypothetical protein
MPESDFDRRRRARDERIEKARGPFKALPAWRIDFGDPWSNRKAPAVVTKLRDALFALREWRRANNQQERDDDEVSLAITIVAGTMAGEIAAAATSQQDSATIAWVVAGLRCPRRPFCTGCESCFTVDAPHRFDVTFAATASNPSGGEGRG